MKRIIAVVGVQIVLLTPASVWPEPNALQQVFVNIYPHQLVGQPLTGSATVLLLDENGTLVTDYDLAANPIILSCGSGVLAPDTINDPALFAGGVVNLGPAQVRYLGPTGNVTLWATTSAIQSSPVLVSFSGYDIEEVVGLSPDTTSRIYANTITSADVRVINRGDQLAISNPNLRAAFVTSGNSNEVSFSPSANAQLETLTITLPTTGLAAGPDTLVLTLQSSYLSGSQTVILTDTLLIQAMTSSAQGLYFVASAVQPDSVYAGIPFDLSFVVALGGVTAPWDSTRYRFELLTDTDSLVATAFDDRVTPESTLSDSLTFREIGAELAEGLTPDVYKSRASFTLFMGGLMLQPAGPFSTDFVVLPKPSLNYQTGTLTPTSVTSGQEWSFEFDLVLDGDRSMTISPTASHLRLSAEEVTVEALFPDSGFVLYPGVNHITTRQMFIPFELLGLSLNPTATVIYYHSGAANHLTMTTDFGSEVVQVQALPLIRILEAHVEAPNAPIVNTAQPFQVVCSVANLSSTPMTPFNLQLVTDGSSQFNPFVTIEEIPGGDTVEAIFPIVAAGTPNPAEIFRVDIASAGVNRLPPIDNIALVTVQLPAEISAVVILRGADQGYVKPGDVFDLLISLVNTGEAQATSGRFRINTNGIDLGLPDGATIIEEVVATGAVRGVSFIAPSFDTTLQIDVDLIQRPIDLNTGNPAITGDSSFQVILPVTSLDLQLHFESSQVPSNIVVPDEIWDLLVLRAFNPATSSVSNIRLTSLKFGLLDADRHPLPVRTVFEVGSTALYDGGYRVATATAGENRLTLLFQDYVIPAGDTVELVLRTRILARDGAEFTLDLQTSDILAEVATGPLQGLSVGAVTESGSDVVVNEVFTLVEHSLAGSFAVRNNPWDPGQEQAEFMYYLPRPDDVTFVVLTLTGETVYRTDYPAGEEGARAGENHVFWNGRSDDGSFVVNGVYVVLVKATASREQATLKLAVMK